MIRSAVLITLGLAAFAQAGSLSDEMRAEDVMQKVSRAYCLDRYPGESWAASAVQADCGRRVRANMRNYSEPQARTTHCDQDSCTVCEGPDCTTRSRAEWAQLEDTGQAKPTLPVAGKEQPQPAHAHYGTSGFWECDEGYSTNAKGACAPIAEAAEH